jgi:GT2 family glycosyltransferase
MISRQCFNNVGYLNEIFSPGSSEDIDYCVRAEKKGFVLEQIPYKETGVTVDRQLITTYPIYHVAEGTVAKLENWGEIFKKNLEILASYHRYPKISIIIPTYNHLEDCLKPCCESIIRNTDFKHIDVIIVANGCTDGTKAYVESLGTSFKLLWFAEAIGYTKAINEGLKAAKSDYIILLNNDIILLDSTWIGHLLKPFLLDDNVGITGPLKFTWPCGFTERTAIAFWCCMLKMDIINEIGFLDQDFSPGMGEDGAYCIEMESIGYKIVQVPVDASKKFGEGVSNQAFPIWHRGNGTFADQEQQKNEIIKRNTAILESKYSNALEQSYMYGYKSFSDTYILFPYFRRYANKCERITEFGVRDVYSTFGFLAARPLKMTSYDIYTSSNINGAKDIAKGSGIDYKFIEHDVLTTEIEETDLLFIDTLHTYGQLSQELKLHANKARKYIMFHDTFTWREKDEIETTTEKKGLYTAIREFLQNNPQWQPELDISISHGLFVLKRIPTFSIIVPTCNNELLKECLSRIFLYTDLIDKEIIVSANGCSSDTMTYLYSLRRKISIINFGEAVGQVKPVNGGVKLAQGKYIILLDDDSLLLPQEKDSWIKMLQAPFLSDPKVGGAGPGYAHYPELGHAIHTFCAMYPKDLWDRVGGGDEVYEYGYLYDADLSFKIQKEGYKIVSVGSLPDGQCVFPIYHPESPATTERKQKDAELLKKNRDILYERYSKKVNEKPTYFPTSENIKISIIIPTYNHLEDCLKPCVESLIKHTNFEGIEVIIVANGCKDGTKDYISHKINVGRYPFKLIWSDEALGFTKATNIGIKEAKGEYIILLNNDTQLLDKGQPKHTWIEMLLAPFKNNEKVGLTGPLHLYDNYAGYMVTIFFCVMIKRKLFEILGPLDEIFSPGGGEDIDLCVKAIKAGYEQVQVPDKNIKLSPTKEGVMNEGFFPIWHKGEGTFSDNADYGNRIIKVNGMRNMSRHHPQIKDGVIKLNFGSGGIEIPGYVSIDKYDKRAYIRLDALECKSIIPNDSVDEIIAIHLIEHLSPYRISELFDVWKNMLKPGGKLILEMPDIEQTCKAFTNSTSRDEKYGLINTIFCPLNTTNEGSPQDITAPHLFGWWPESLLEHLSWAGFVDIKFMPEQHPHPGFNFRSECIKPV